MSKKKLVIFDWGGVLEDAKSATCHKTIDLLLDIVSKLNVPNDIDTCKERIQEFLDSTKCYYDVLTKKDNFTMERYVSGILDAVGLESSYENIYNFKIAYIITVSERMPNIELIKYAHSIKDRCKLGLFSNLSLYDVPKQDADVQRSMFDYLWLSCDMGYAKPDSVAYRRVNEVVLNYKYDVLFIDNSEDNLTSPRALGWKTFRYTGDNKEVIEAIEKFLEE